MNNKRKNKAVAEIIGTILLLAVAVSAIAVIYFQVLSDDGPSPTNIVRVVGKGEGGYIYLEHMGGDDIDLDNTITYTIAGYTYPLTKIRELLENEKPLNDIYWSIGERLKIPIRYNLDKLDEYQIAEITAVDSVSNSIIFYGPINLPQPTSDLGIDIDVEYLDGHPVKADDRVQIIITLTSYGGNVNGSGGVIVNYQIPHGLIYNNSYSPTGHNKEPYNNVTGNWNAGNILVGHPAVLKINLTVDGSVARTPTQLALVIDGSGSIGSTWFKWDRADDQKNSGSYSLKSTKDHDGYFGCNNLDASDASSITIDFYYRIEHTSSSNPVREQDFVLDLYDGNDWNKINFREMENEPEGEWIHKIITITDEQYLIPDFKIRFNSNLRYWFFGWRERGKIWIDDVLITTDSKTLLNDGFERDGIWWKANWQPCDWDLIRIGLAEAILNSSIFPHDGSVELTVIQFGGSSSQYGRTWAQVELGGSKIITDSNNIEVVNDILTISQLGGGTAMSCAFRLAADVLSGDPNSFLVGTSEAGMASPNAHWGRQAVILITDGMPNIIYDHNQRYTGTWAGLIDGEQYEFIHGKSNSENARNYLLNLLNMNESIDEINSLAVGVGGMYGAPDVNWLNSSIVWPNPYIWDITIPNSFSGPGWVSNIESFQEFGFAINEMFTALFSIHNTVNFVSSTTYDPNPGNHKATVTIG
jgi:flagellin-like protein